MFDFGQFAIYVLAIMVFFVIPILRLLELKRKYDFRCFVLGYYVCVVFFYLALYVIIIGKFELLPEVISSAVIALLTLAFVWAELSKRPELEMLGSVPLIRHSQTLSVYKADYHGTLSKPSTFLRIKEASFPNTDLQFNEGFSFAVDLANIGYEEIMVHEYVLYIDGKRQKPIPLGRLPNSERLRLTAQQRHPIDMPSLHVKSVGFHKISVKAIATTETCSKEIWFFISEDFKKLRYVEMYPVKRLLSPLIKNALRDS
ncbi:MAG TPA: hypothetical protein VJ249_04215 [Candidatus Bathyarchaeia archaeon]|nr:hypothetical protein [Candidatus Bathyarchaeia archaeon]